MTNSDKGMASAAFPRPGRTSSFYAAALCSLMIIAAGALLWWREGDRLFSDGLIMAMMRCF